MTIATVQASPYIFCQDINENNINQLDGTIKEYAQEILRLNKLNLKRMRNSHDTYERHMRILKISSDEHSQTRKELILSKCKSGSLKDDVYVAWGVAALFAIVLLLCLSVILLKYYGILSFK